MQKLVLFFQQADKSVPYYSEIAANGSKILVLSADGYLDGCFCMLLLCKLWTMTLLIDKSAHYALKSRKSLFCKRINAVLRYSKLSCYTAGVGVECAVRAIMRLSGWQRHWHS